MIPAEFNFKNAKKKWHSPKIGGVRESITMFLGAFYLIASQMEERDLSNAGVNKPLGYSWSTVGFTTVLALLIAAGTTYIHFIQESFHKKYSHMDARNTIELINPAVQDSAQHLNMMQQLNYRWKIITADGILSPFQVFMLLVATIGHAGDFIGFITSITDEVLEDELSKNSLIGINFGLFIFGVIASGAEIRSCWIDMIKNNLLEDTSGRKMLVNTNDLPSHSDFWTIASLCAKAAQTLVANMVLYCHFIDACAGFSKNTSIGSKRGLSYSLIFALPIMIGTVYGQYAINFLQQGPCHTGAIEDVEESSSTKPAIELSFYDSALLSFRPLGTAGDFAAQLTDLFEPFLTANWLKIIIQILATVFGLLGSGSDHMNAEENLKDFKDIFKKTPISLFWSSCSKKNDEASMNQQLLRPSVA